MKAAFLQTSLGTVVLTSLAPAIWGTTYWVATEFLPEGRPLLAAAIRTLPAGVLLILLTRSFRPALPWGRLCLLSMLNIGAFQALLFVAAYRLPGGIAAIAGSLQPLMVLALAWAVDRERPAAMTVGTAMLAVVGMAVLLLTPGAAWDGLGVAAALVGSASMAAGTFLSRRWKSDMSLVAFTGWQLALGGVVLLPLALRFEPAITRLSPGHVAAYAYLSLVGTVLAYTLWFRGIARLPPVAVSALGLLSPLTAVVFGWVLLGERLSLADLAAMTVVLVSVLAFQWQLRPQAWASTAVPVTAKAL